MFKTTDRAGDYAIITELERDVEWWENTVKGHEDSRDQALDAARQWWRLRQEASEHHARLVARLREAKICAGIVRKAKTWHRPERVQARRERVQEYIDTGLFDARQAVVADMMTHPEAWEMPEPRIEYMEIKES